MTKNSLAVPVLLFGHSLPFPKFHENLSIIFELSHYQTDKQTGANYVTHFQKWSGNKTLVCCELFVNRSRDLEQWSGTSDVISDVIRLPSEARGNNGLAPYSDNGGLDDVTYQQQQQPRQRGGRGSRRTESSADVARRPKRHRYEYNELQRRLLCDVYAKRKSLH